MIDERLTPSFWLSEFLRSDAATRKGLDNTPLPSEMANLKNILVPGMQHVREMLGMPILITSGYRSPEVNKAVGGAKTSQHSQGLAADFVAPHFGPPREVVKFLMQRAGEARFDQLIHEGGWVHISFVASKPRYEVLTAHFTQQGVSYTPGLEERRA